MLSSLIWGAPKQTMDIAGPVKQKVEQQQDVQFISDDVEEEQEQEQEQEQEEEEKELPMNRYNANQKGKGRGAPQMMSSTGGLKSSQTFGDMRSIQQEMSVPPATNLSQQTTQGGQNPSPAELNSTLASFFAEKGSAVLTAEERKRVSELLLGRSGNGPATTTEAEIPTALTPNFSFQVPTKASNDPVHTSVSHAVLKG